MLPKYAIPTFELIVPTTKEKIKYRQYLAKEEKVLLIAQESNEDTSMYEALKQLVSVCVQTPNFNISKLTMPDLEYIFLNIRAKSVNNILKQTYKDTEDDKNYEFNIDLEKVNVVFNENNKTTFKLFDDVGVVMKYPTLALIDPLKKTISEFQMTEELTFEVIKACIDTVYDKEKIYIFNEETPEDQKTFLETLPISALNKIKTFFETLPKLYYKIEYTNSKGTERKIEFSRLSDFFTWR